MSIKRSAIILCGNRNEEKNYKHKGALIYRDKSLLDISLEAVEDFEEIILIGKDDNLFNKYKGRFQLIEKEFKEKDLILALYEGLLRAKSHKVLFLSCNMPYLNKVYINYFGSMDFLEGALIPIINSKIKYTCGVYSKEILKTIKNMLDNKNYNIKDIFKKESVRYIFPRNQEMFITIDTVEDYINLRKMES